MKCNVPDLDQPNLVDHVLGPSRHNIVLGVKSPNTQQSFDERTADNGNRDSSYTGYRVLSYESKVRSLPVRPDDT